MKLAVFRSVKHDADRDYVAARHDYAESIAQSVAGYYSYFTRRPVEAHGYAVPYEGSYRTNTNPMDYKFYWFDTVNEFMQDKDFEPDTWHMIGGGTGCCGRAIRGGNQSTRCLNMTCGLSTDIHEVGHSAFNLGHSGLIYENGTIAEYGDNSSAIMGGTPAHGNKVVGINAAHLYMMGLVSPLAIQESGEYQIAAVEIPDICLRQGEARCLLVSGNEHDYIISYRKADSIHPFALPEKHKKTLFVHRLSPKNSCHRMLPDLQPGESKELGGVRIEHLGFDAAKESLEVGVVV